MTIRKIVFLLILIPTTASSAEWFTDLSPQEVVLQSYWTAAAVIDWGTTLDITERYDEGYYEMNPFLGKRPSRGEVNTWFLIGIPVKWLVTWALPREAYFFDIKWYPRKTFQIIGASIQTAAVVNNFSVGLKINF